MNESIRWMTTDTPPALAANAIHLWRIRADETGMDLNTCLRLLGERQRARAERMRHQPYRERYIRAQAGLRLILGRYLDTDPGSIRFGHGPAGKPFVDSSGHPIAFNLTTTGDLALVAVGAGNGPDSEIGVDCEWIHPRNDIQAIARRMFSPEVAESLAQLPEAERLERFYRNWTALEADAKCDGRGLFRPRAPDAVAPQVLNCIPEPGYVAAVARARLPAVEQWLAFDLIRY
ncbi:4'-phosphopantetheinyl transferase [Thiorhodococcus drewsii AZ1]|uniref:4'-phosphopantetheinyl transferase n=1 Tax=Thiorhodococcus drewsii AZ1 TaxID=765913 RepID=G2E5I2_9GAMM|nr:4'-phosphopantetheinyl transferase superfamily protein [Thiorhodococcus drewsii]EGV28651.1 4'-phosphopantetheinyl transferase [Thiorhodococcus drewsii AZ1]